MESKLQYEKLGLLYLGKELEIDSRAGASMPLLYKSKNLTTHGVIIGMTGSGKTGLGVGLIEEAIMDDIPSIIIDPKGDMANLALSFPELAPADFKPWVDPAEASRKNLSVDAFAEKTARNWREGLAAWDQDGERIGELRRKSRLTIYTPGSSSGVPVSIMAGFSAPSEEVMADLDGLNAMVGSTATSLLSLVNISGDPLTSREHILVSSILLHYWRDGHDLDLESLIGAIVNPPFERVGVFGLADFFPQPQRMQLAMAINNVIASPSFGAWLQGQPLDLQTILYGSEGEPRTAIFSIAHLGESERMFFVTLLLNSVIGWMRKQQGTSSLRALLYMDEIFGYFPPTGNPPSKKPMLILLKQARAFGIGVVLATQNPVDLDYKGLSNIGTWFVGRLQTSQDQDRVLEGIVGSSDGQLERAEVRKMLAGMQGRQFLLTSAHLEEPVLFETRWVMSYLKGPISLQDIKLLNQERGDTVRAPTPAARIQARPDGLQDSPPLLNEAIVQRYCLPSLLSEEPRFAPYLAGSATVRFYNARRNIDQTSSVRLRVYLESSREMGNWSESEDCGVESANCGQKAPSGCLYYSLPPDFLRLKNLKGAARSLSDYLYQTQRLELFRAPTLKLESHPGESRAEFFVRITSSLREKQDEAATKLLKGYGTKRKRLQTRLDRALEKINKERSDVSAKTTDTIISFGTAILGAFLGRKAVSSSTMTRTAGSIRKASRISKEKEDVRRAEAVVADLEEEIRQLETAQGQALVQLAAAHDPAAVEVERFAIKPRRSDIFDVDVWLLWEMAVE